MKFIGTWKAPTASYADAIDKFLSEGADVPDGVTMLGRWHAPASVRGWMLVETDDPALFSQHLAEWAHMLEIEMFPVLDDAEAGAVLSRARRS